MPISQLKRGDVFLVHFPNSDLRTVKTRPVLVVQADGLSTGLPQIIVAMITSRVFRAGPRYRVPVRAASAAGRRAGLLTDSIVMADNLATVAIATVQRVIGTLEMGEMDDALRTVLGR